MSEILEILLKVQKFGHILVIFSIYFYCCNLHFEDSIIITYQQMH
jgi:hypothetical protein